MQFPVLSSKLKRKHRMNALLVIRVTFLMSVILAGVNGFIIVILVPSLKIRRSLVEHSDHARMKAMRCHSPLCLLAVT